MRQQSPRARADQGLGRIHRHCRQALLNQQAVQRSNQVWRRIDERAVQIEDEGPALQVAVGHDVGLGGSKARLRIVDGAERLDAGTIHDQPNPLTRRRHPGRRPGHADEVAAAQGAAPRRPSRHAGSRHRCGRGAGLRAHRGGGGRPLPRGPGPCRGAAGPIQHRGPGPAAGHRPRRAGGRGGAFRVRRGRGGHLRRCSPAEGVRHRTGLRRRGRDGGRVSCARSRRLWPPDPGRRHPARNHRGQGGVGGGSGAHRLQLGCHGRALGPAVPTAG